MREILFRGKRMDNGEWIEGFYGVKIGDKHYIIIDKLAPAPCCDSYFVDCAVIPETVGQYTGLMDKNGRRIFEGDIVKETFEGTTIEYEGDWSEFREEVDFYGNKIGAVTFTGTGTHLKATQGEIWVNGEDVEDWKPSRRTRLSARRCEVIGNIHDNPEMLKEE